uniref:Uncharacterized protein n=1 Tax=viral metagenome TaxID=1070528 RepID=A0A6M3XSG3_9ZZZZ
MKNNVKPTTYTEGNITLETKGSYESGWYLSVAEVLGNGGNWIAIEEEEIKRIADVCVRWLLDHEKPPKGLKKAVAKK